MAQQEEVEFLDAAGGGVDEELDTAPPRRPWWLLAVLALLLVAVVAVVVRGQHAAPSARAPASSSGPVIPDFGSLSAPPVDDPPPGIAFPVPLSHPRRTVTLDPQVPILAGGPSECEPCRSDTTVITPVRAAVAAHLPGMRVVTMNSAIDLPIGLHRPLAGRTVFALGAGRVLLVLVQRQPVATGPVQQTSPDGRVRTVTGASGPFFVQASLQGPPGRLPSYAQLWALVHDARLVAKR